MLAKSAERKPEWPKVNVVVIPLVFCPLVWLNRYSKNGGHCYCNCYSPKAYQSVLHESQCWRQQVHPNQKRLTAYRPLGPEGRYEEVPDADPGAGRRCLPQTTRSAGANGLSLTENRCEKMQNLYRTDDDNHKENESGTDGDGNPGSDHANALEKAWLS